MWSNAKKLRFIGIRRGSRRREDETVACVGGTAVVDPREGGVENRDSEGAPFVIVHLHGVR